MSIDETENVFDIIELRVKHESLPIKEPISSLRSDKFVPMVHFHKCRIWVRSDHKRCITE